MGRKCFSPEEVSAFRNGRVCLHRRPFSAEGSRAAIIRRLEFLFPKFVSPRREDCSPELAKPRRGEKKDLSFTYEVGTLELLLSFAEQQSYAL
jgi:hypothetical protein